MVNANQAHEATLSGPVSRVVRYEQAWQSGAPLSLADWLQQHPSPSLDELGLLVCADLRLRSQAGMTWRLEDYFSTFPALLQQPDLAVVVIQQEVALLGRQASESPADYASRFPSLAGELSRVAETARLSLPIGAPPASNACDTVSYLEQPASTRNLLRGELRREPTPTGFPQIAGYEILDFVAKGGMGVVYKARDRTLGRHVALKLPRPGYVESESDKDRFLREARAAARLRHANICPLFEARETADGRPFICMAFIDGDTLKNWVTKHRPGPRQLAELVAILARAVQYAHEQGVVHRDLKPSNAMVESGSNQPLLMDFGLAKDLSQEDGLTISGDVMGTPAYMAPEQASGRTHEIGPAVDTYALGAILYELLCGEPPFRGTVLEVLQHVQDAEPTSLRQRLPQIHIDLETICQKAMAKRAPDRYATAGALADDLERFARGEAILARRQSAVQRMVRLLGKHRLVVGLGTTALVAILLLLSLLPALRQGWQLNRMTTHLEAELTRADWSPQMLAELDGLATEIAGIAPEQAADHRRRIASRLDSYVSNYLNPNRGKWSDEDWSNIDAAIAELELRDAHAAQQRHADADRIRGLPERVADLRQPWKNYPDVLPDLVVDEAGRGLKLAIEPSESSLPVLTLSNQASDGEFHIETIFALPPKSVAGLAINVKQMHAGGITALAIHPHDPLFASASIDGKTIHCWETERGTDQFTLPGHANGIRSLDFSPDGKWLVSAGFDEQAKIWNVAERKLARTLSFSFRDLHHEYSVLVGPPAKFSNDGQRLFVGCGASDKGEVQVWSVPDFEPLGTLAGPSSPIVSLAQPVDGMTLWAGTIEGEIYVWETASGKLLRNFTVPTAGLTALAVDAAGQRLAAANAKGLIHVCDAAGAPQQSLQGFAAGTYALAFDPNAKGELLAAGYEDGTVKIWDLTTQQVARSSLPVGGRCHALVYAPGGGWALAGNNVGVIQRLEMSTANEQYRLSGQQYEFLVARSLDGHEVQLESRRNGTLLRSVAQNVGAGALKLTIRRNDELVGMQVNANPEVIFRDHFPPVPIQGGQWGVILSRGTALQQLIARRRLKRNIGSPLEQGDLLFRQNELGEALDFFDQQIAVASGENAGSVRDEAQFKAAMCLLRLNRLDEAGQRLEALATDSAATVDSPGFVARFQIWLLRLQQRRLDDANSLFNTIRVTVTPDEIPLVIAAENQQQILRYYDATTGRRKLLLEPGMLPRLEATLAVHEYLKVPGDDFQNLRWQYLEALRLLGNAGDARRAADQLVGGLELRLHPPASPSGIDVETLERWSKYALVCRQIDQPQRAETLFDTQLWDGTHHLRPAVSGPALGLLLERARLHAYRQQWEQADQCLEQLLHAADLTAVPRITLIRSHLLRGFVLRHLERASDAQQAWRDGCARLELTEIDLDQTADGEEGLQQFLDALALGALGERWQAADLKLAQAKLLRWIGTMSGMASVLPAISPASAALQLAWLSPQGQVFGEQIAGGNLTNSERLAGFMKLLIAEWARQGAFAGTPSAEQGEIVYQLCEGGLRAYLLGEIRMAAIVQVGLAWTGAPNFLGWQAILEGMPRAIQAETAFVLAHRSLSRGRQKDARELLEMAVTLSDEAAPVHSLAKSEIDSLGAP